jgi:hypothetical protein
LIEEGRGKETRIVFEVQEPVLLIEPLGGDVVGDNVQIDLRQIRSG